MRRFLQLVLLLSFAALSVRAQISTDCYHLDFFSCFDAEECMVDVSPEGYPYCRTHSCASLKADCNQDNGCYFHTETGKCYPLNDEPPCEDYFSSSTCPSDRCSFLPDLNLCYAGTLDEVPCNTTITASGCSTLPHCRFELFWDGTWGVCVAQEDPRPCYLNEPTEASCPEGTCFLIVDPDPVWNVCAPIELLYEMYDENEGGSGSGSGSGSGDSASTIILDPRTTNGPSTIILDPRTTNGPSTVILDPRTTNGPSTVSLHPRTTNAPSTVDLTGDATTSAPAIGVGATGLSPLAVGVIAGAVVIAGAMISVAIVRAISRRKVRVHHNLDAVVTGVNKDPQPAPTPASIKKAAHGGILIPVSPASEV